MKSIAEEQYLTILQPVLKRADIEILLRCKTTKASDIIKTLRYYAQKTGKCIREANLISSKIFLEYYGLTLDEFKERALMEREYKSSI